MTPGIDYFISHEDYLAMDRLSASGIKQLLRSPAHYREAVTHPTPPTPAQQLGTAVHIAVLEPERFLTSVRVRPTSDKRTKAGKEEHAEFDKQLPSGGIALHAEQYCRTTDMRNAVMANPYARALLENGKPEGSIFWNADGVQAKARIDWLCEGHDVLLDLKTAKDASFEGFAKACGTYQYHVQHAWYLAGAEQVGLGKRQFVFLVVESEPPHGVALYQLDNVAVTAGEARIQRALEIYRECRLSGVWPGYEESIQQLSLPRWAL